MPLWSWPAPLTGMCFTITGKTWWWFCNPRSLWSHSWLEINPFFPNRLFQLLLHASPPSGCGDLKLKVGSTGLDWPSVLYSSYWKLLLSVTASEPFCSPLSGTFQELPAQPILQPFQKKVEGPWFSHFIHFFLFVSPVPLCLLAAFPIAQPFFQLFLRQNIGTTRRNRKFPMRTKQEIGQWQKPQ